MGNKVTLPLAPTNSPVPETIVDSARTLIGYNTLGVEFKKEYSQLIVPSPLI